MRKRVVALLFALLFSIMGFFAGDEKVKAEEPMQDVALSDIWTEDALVGYATSQTWGVYLADGVSVINDAGSNKIGCGGITNASRQCKVTVAVIVEKKVNGSWTRVTSWTAVKENAYSVITSKTLSVGSGYYYRVRCLHYAGTDSSSSYTEGMWM